MAVTAPEDTSVLLCLKIVRIATQKGKRQKVKLPEYDRDYEKKTLIVHLDFI